MGKLKKKRANFKTGSFLSGSSSLLLAHYFHHITVKKNSDLTLARWAHYYLSAVSLCPPTVTYSILNLYLMVI